MTESMSVSEISNVSNVDMNNEDGLVIKSFADPTPSEFHLFPKLPLELREAIWRLALPRRTFELRRNNTGSYKYNQHGQSRYFWSLIRSSAVTLAPPVLVKVSREARAVALRSGSVRTVASDWAANPPRWLRTWFDPSTDMMCISEWGLLGKEWGVNTPGQFDVDTKSLCFSFGALSQEPGRQFIRQWLGPTTVWSNRPQYSFYIDSITMRLVRSKNVDEIFGSDSEIGYSTLIDVGDFGKLKRMRQLFADESYLGYWKPRVLELLDDIIDPYKNGQYVRQTYHELRNLWLVAHAASMSHNDPIRIGIRKYPDTGHVLLSMDNINQQHPWCRSILEKMPDFSLMIHFQLYLTDRA